MNYKIVAMEDLRMYKQRIEALKSIQRRIEALNSQFSSIKSSCADTSPVQGGASVAEDRLIDNIVERERLALNYKTTKILIEIIERGLNALSPDEKKVLITFAECRRDSRAADRLADQMHLGRSTVYRIRDTALYKYTIGCYGIADL